MLWLLHPGVPLKLMDESLTHGPDAFQLNIHESSRLISVHSALNETLSPLSGNWLLMLVLLYVGGYVSIDTFKSDENSVDSNRVLEHDIFHVYLPV